MCCLFCVGSGGFDVCIEAEPSTKGVQSVGYYRFIDFHNLPYFFMCFMYLFQPLLPDPHSNMNMTYDHCRLLREKHNDKVSVLNWNKFVPILAHGVCVVWVSSLCMFCVVFVEVWGILMCFSGHLAYYKCNIDVQDNSGSSSSQYF